MWQADGEPSDDRRQQHMEDQEPAESRRRTADTDDTVLESQEQSSAASQDQGKCVHLCLRLATAVIWNLLGTLPRLNRQLSKGGKTLSELQVSLAIWDHAWLLATWHKWTRPALTPAGKLVLDLPTPEGWKAELTSATRQCTELAIQV